MKTTTSQSGLWLLKVNILHMTTMQERRVDGYVYKDYKPGASVYQFTNLIIGTNLQVRTMPSQNSSKVCYFLPDIEHERLMETIIIRDDPKGLVV